MINIENLSLVYKSGKGVFDLNFKVNKGEIMGYLGPNGAGKTTTIRALLGFMAPNKGNCSINGLDCSKNATEIQKILGYIPGEINFFDGLDGNDFLKFINKMRGTKNCAIQKRLLDMFEFSPKGKIKKFSKGMKQKLGIVTAFMHDPKVIILDEPTSGLDPLMQTRFVDLIIEEKKKGKTILMSSHMFEEVERTCDNVLIIKDGRIVAQSDTKTLKSSQRKGFVIRSSDSEKMKDVFKSEGLDFTSITEDEVEVFVSGDSIDRLIKLSANFKVIGFETKSQSLEDVFMHLYSKGVK